MIHVFKVTFRRVRLCHELEFAIFAEERRFDGMITVETTRAVPITTESDGTWRVEGSRVTVEVVLGQFKRGSTPEQIQDDFSTLSLAKIYGVIGYYLSHPQEVEAYLAERKTRASEIREKWESHLIIT